MSRGNAFRGGKVHVKAEKCATCIFRPGNLMHLDPGRVAGMVAEAKRKDSAIICHSTLGTRKNAVCRGFFDSHGTIPLRLARIMGNVEEVP
jgi:hypothetical protein